MRRGPVSLASQLLIFQAISGRGELAHLAVVILALAGLVPGLDVLVDQGGTEQRRRWPGISALGSALRGPRANAGPRTIGTAGSSWLKCAAVEV
jgi:hypothetical protein